MPTVLYSEKRKIKKWWVSLLLGILYMGLGIWMLRTPFGTYASLSLIFGAFILLLGLLWTAFSISVNNSLPGWGWFLAGGLLELIIGVLLLFYPAITLTILPLFIGFWLLLGGIMGIGSSFQYKSLGGKGWGWLLALGIFTVLFSIVLLINPIYAGISIVFMTAFSLITLGVFRMVFALNLRKLHNSEHEE